MKKPSVMSFMILSQNYSAHGAPLHPPTPAISFSSSTADCFHQSTTPPVSHLHAFRLLWRRGIHPSMTVSGARIQYGRAPGGYAWKRVRPYRRNKVKEEIDVPGVGRTARAGSADPPPTKTPFTKYHSLTHSPAPHPVSLRFHAHRQLKAIL